MREQVYEIVVGIILVVIIGCSIGTIKCNAVEVQAHDKQYAIDMEQDYKSLIQDSLTEEGFYYSGITMTKIYEQDGITSYKIKLHNDKFEKLSKEGQRKLIYKLQGLKTASKMDEQRKEFLILNF